VVAITEPPRRTPCPCCGYPTLEERAAYEICCLCNWEDDGQDDPRADEVWGGPNGSYSLAAARQNFRHHWVMYSPDNDTRMFSGDSDVQLSEKKAMARAFDAMVGADETETERLWQMVTKCKEALDRELERRISEHEAAIATQS
jgi:hypothetical protein